MIVDVIDRLVDRCIQLVRHKEEVRRHLFDDFVNPIHSDFEAVHQDYLDTFRKYREMVNAPAPLLNESHPVLDAIKADAIFNAKLRIRIHGMISADSDPLLGGFISSILNYFRWVGVGTHELTADDFDPVYDPASNISRETAVASLRKIFSSGHETEVKRLKATETIDEIVAMMQRNYAVEVREFFNLKKVLLTLL